MFENQALGFIDDDNPQMKVSYSMKDSKQCVIKCIRCKNKPKQQFMILLCDHILCGNCMNPSQTVSIYDQNDQETNMIPVQLKKHVRDKQTFGEGLDQPACYTFKKKIKLNEGYQGVRCPCGVVTYFGQGQSEQQINENQRKFNLKVNMRDQAAEQNQYLYNSRRASTRPSTGLIYSRNTVPSFTHNQLSSINKKDRFKTQTLDCDTNYNYSPQSRKLSHINMIESHQNHKNPKNTTKIRTPHTNQMMQQSLYSIQNTQHYDNNIIRSCVSTPQIKKYRGKHNNNYYAQMLKQLAHVKHSYEYEVSNLQKRFNQIIDVLHQKFNEVQEKIKDLYCQNLVMRSNKYNEVDLARLVSDKFHSSLQVHIDKLSDYLSHYYHKAYASQDRTKRSARNSARQSRKSSFHEQKNRKENQAKNSNQCGTHPVINIYAKSPVHQYAESLGKGRHICEKHNKKLNEKYSSKLIQQQGKKLEILQSPKKLLKKSRAQHRNLIIEL